MLYIYTANMDIVDMAYSYMYNETQPVDLNSTYVKTEPMDLSNTSNFSYTDDDLSSLYDNNTPQKEDGKFRKYVSYIYMDVSKYKDK